MTDTNTATHDGVASYPSSIFSRWFTIANARNEDAASSGSFYQVGTAPEFTEDEILNVPINGAVSTLLLRIRYPDGFTAFTEDAQVCVVGRHGSSDEWMKLPNRDNEDGVATKITLTTDVTNDLGSVNPAGGTNYKVSDVDTSKHWFDIMGCSEIGVIVVRNVDVGVQGGSVNIQGKWL